MDYGFSRHGRGFGRVVFALALDHRKMMERIVIARADEARLRLGRGAGDVFLDAPRPLGSLLANFKGNPKREWNSHCMKLRESYGKTFPFEAERWKMARSARKYLREQYESGEPFLVFAAVRAWEEYLNCHNMNHGADILAERLNLLCRPFSLYAGSKPWQDAVETAVAQTVDDRESQVELWYPAKKRPFEVVVAVSSFLPVISYYLYKLEEWGFVFQECKVCGKHFAARSRHYELCSDGCRHAKAVEAKREFDERAKGNRLEQVYETAYNYWYTRLRKLKKGKNADPEKTVVVKAAFDSFRKEAVRRKGDVKRGEAKLSDFAGWLVEQNEAVDQLMNMGAEELLQDFAITSIENDFVDLSLLNEQDSVLQSNI
ncbi:MAG: hypothetical protein LBI54_08240 [Lachnospiraceae bacterium]|jgi:hypothetical protein|nr:hypothetical protein [Lachnospiraceae bacterium]